MSLSSILSIASSGLAASQTGLRTVSDNVANVGTPGYVRKVADQTSSAVGGMGSGVTTAQLRLATDKFLQAAGLKASADNGAAAARGDIVDQAQTLFGDPNAATSLFNSLDQVFAGFTALNATPGATSQAAAVGQTASFLDQANTISAGLGDLETQADSRIQTDVDTVNGLLTKINSLNTEISRASVGGGDATGSQETQSQLIDQLSSLLNVSVSQRAQGGVTLRSSDGVLLAGDGAATLSYEPGAAGGRLFATPASGVKQSLDAGSGEIGGLLQTRNTDLPGIASQLAELTSGVVDQLNAAHNAYSAAPPPATLTGRDTGLPLSTAVSGFTGKTSIGVVDGSGNLVRAAAIDFDAQTITVGGAATRFTPASFLSTLNTALSPAGSASFANGALSLSASGGNGVAVADDPTTPAAKAGKGFSDFFGLNDLVTSSKPSDYATGLSASDPSPFTSGGAISLRFTGGDGTWLRDVTVAAPAGGTVGDLLSALNSPTGGAGLYGTFALDSQGRMSFTSTPGSSAQLGVVSDTTASSASPGVSATALFGIDPVARAQRAQSFNVRTDIASDPTQLALAKVSLTGAVGAQALSSGDSSGADALSQAGSTVRRFGAAGSVGATSLTVSTYAARMAASLSSTAADADSAATHAAAVSTDAASRRSSQEGVNLDQELIALTSYQQAYNASARLVQAAKDLYDTLLQMVN